MNWLEAADEAAAQEQLYGLGCTDGLPVIVPTAPRVDRMVLASGLDRDLSLGTMGPAGGAATVEALAVAAVMAGCPDELMPVLCAATEAVLDPAFDLTEMQATTHCTAPLILMSGPVVEALGFASGFGALGPGHRANATLGRALRLAMINIGGGRPGESDMALLGHPGKFTFCLAEAQDASPFPAFQESLGFTETDSVVTVIGAEAPQSLIFSASGNLADDEDGLLCVLAAGLAGPASNNAVLTGGQAVLVLNPDHAALLARAGYTRERLQAALHERCVVDGDRRALGSFRREGTRHAFRAPEDILVLVAGGSGLYSMAMPSWCAGPHQNRAVSRAIDLNPACALPF
ncbi:MAG: hypothetical protein RLZZ174_1660 [Pseudomonadota bacterium]